MKKSSNLRMSLGEKMNWRALSKILAVFCEEVETLRRASQ